MSTNTLETAYANGEIIDASHVNELTLALLSAFVGRDANGVPTPAQSLGTLAIPWGNLYANGVIINGQAVDTSTITSAANRIVSGATRPLSTAADYLRADGAALEFDILGATTDLVLSINNTAVSINTDITKAALTAAPSTNNTCDVNDTDIVSDLHAGEYGASIAEITIDAVGTEISSRIGQLAAFEAPTGEILFAYIKDATTLTNVFRGYYFDSTGSSIGRDVLSNNDTLTLLNIAWVFVEDNGTTVDVSYNTPSISYDSPSSPATGDYWFDISNQVWKRYSGITFEIINRILIGQVVTDSTNAVASRSGDFSNQYSEQNNIELEVISGEIIESKTTSTKCNVYGTEVEVDVTSLNFNITTDLEGGFSEASDTYYYLYISDKGQRILSPVRPYFRPDLKGFYHPFESWRMIGESYNDSSSDLARVSDLVKENSMVKLYGGNGRGSSSTAIRRYSVVDEYLGTAIEYTDSATLGALLIIREDGHYTISHSEVNGSATPYVYGPSRNSSELTTSFQSLTVDKDRLAITDTSSASGDFGSVSWEGILKSGDVIRPHGVNGFSPSNSNTSSFTISKSTKLKG